MQRHDFDYLLLVLAACIGSTAAATGTLMDIDRVDFLAQHNHVRANVTHAANMQKMVWDDELAKLAAGWAVQCVSPTQADGGSHRPVDQLRLAGYNVVGENLEWTVSQPDAASVLSDWTSTERLQFNANTAKCNGKWQKCGHYTQVVWASTCAVGCAVAHCAEPIDDKYEFFTVCNYGPGGNTATENGDDILAPYIVGKQCSSCGDRNCSTDTNFCNHACLSASDEIHRQSVANATVTLKQIQKQIGEALINNAETSPNLLTLALLGGGVPTDLLGAANNALASSALAGTIVNGNTVARRGVVNSGTEAVPAACISAHPLCAVWAAGGECERNPDVMVRTCARDCNPPACAVQLQQLNAASGIPV